MIGLIFGEIVVRLKELTARQTRFEETYDSMCHVMKNHGIPVEMQNEIIIHRQTQQRPKYEEEELETFKSNLCPRLRSRINRFVLGSLLMDNEDTAPFILQIKYARGLVELAKYLEFRTYGPEEMIT